MSKKRKMVSIQVIHDIVPIEGADRIEIAKILGWQCVIPKNEYKKYDKVIFFEVDSFLPLDNRYEFLRTSCFKKHPILGEGFIIKTAKMRGELSQGLILPIDEFPEVLLNPDKKYLKVGADLTDLLNVKNISDYFEERATGFGNIIGELPPTIPHTKETRVQAEPGLLVEFLNFDPDEEYYITTKLDGSSHSCSLDKTGFHVYGHNYEYAKDDACPFYKILRDNNIPQKMEKYKDKYPNLVLQGELCGGGIQGNPLMLPKLKWFVFNAIVDGQRVDLYTLKEIVEDMDLDMVPIEEVGLGSFFKNGYSTIYALLKRAEGDYNDSFKKEGIVIRPVNPKYSEIIKTDLSMKVINNEYLLNKRKKKGKK